MTLYFWWIGVGTYAQNTNIADDTICVAITTEAIVATDVTQSQYVQCLRGAALKTIAWNMYLEADEVGTITTTTLPKALPWTYLDPVWVSVTYGDVYVYNPPVVGPTAWYEGEMNYTLYLAWLAIVMLLVWGILLLKRKKEQE